MYQNRLYHLIPSLLQPLRSVSFESQMNQQFRLGREDELHNTTA